ncbi:restriction endonuclease subunit S [Lactiplantibacillus plantarum]|uniref:restriction endonuclease subunit S n=1 Tax=Lactiplantibacillus plantarum TaxID=1590 RepID=UPI0013E02F3D|nr:restriction endonuclease subunit S [Lactiplantibacillus plantarum]MDI5785669.1 restriction endonuclease subunit S [Lactiplantibacillus plantarum]NGM26435.1 restriction endonuclease subunit S [Lactiplantibacillus plantarum]
MKDNQAKYPQLRFKCFTDPWEQRKVSELADRYDNLRVPITASERVAGETPYYGANGIQDYVEGFTHNGEFVLVAEDGANDLQNYPVQYVDGKVWVNNHAHVLQAKEERVDNKFLTNALKHTNIEPYLVGGGRAKLNADVMMKINFKVPTLPEQVQIGKFFDNLDHLITLHQRKLTKLKELKQGYLQKLFPKNGSKFPQLRFAGFADAWEQRKLKDTLSLIKDGTHGTHKDGNFSMLLSTKNLINGKVVFNKSKDRKIGKKDYDSIFKGYSIHEKDVLLSVVGSIGRLALYYPQDIPIAFQRSVAILRGNKSLEQEFLKYVLETHDAQRQLKMRTTMSAQPDLFLGDLSQVMIKVPIFKEQIKIIKIFDSISNLIASNQRKLEKLQELKKGYLQKMFC